MPFDLAWIDHSTIERGIMCLAGTMSYADVAIDHFSAACSSCPHSRDLLTLQGIFISLTCVIT